MIEATRTDDACGEPPLSRTRGICSPAQCAVGCGYPGPLRPGLIEALISASVTNPIRPTYPGPLRPGLIEASPTTPKPRTTKAYPGPLRPGLIEAGESDISITVTTAYPGPLRPGLIEAG